MDKHPIQGGGEILLRSLASLKCRLCPHLVLYMDTVKPLHTGHLGDRGKWLLLRDGHYGEVGVRLAEF